ncbi:MAG: alpha/beta fold hydrolase [Acidihalobacter sp.]|uniref:alpha/beta fold hydrolase n=1 Tax=Acidihalobacter sp. TaxID=1872108 RepID=UPI00307E417B
MSLPSTTCDRALAHDTLIVHGREDRVIPLQNTYDLLARIPRAQLHVFGECGHWTQIEHAARFNRLLLEHFTDS